VAFAVQWTGKLTVNSRQAQRPNWRFLRLTFFPVIDTLRIASSPLGVSPERAPPDPLPAGATATGARVAKLKCNYENEQQT